eukprot:TRINITY_DN2790_c0_g1_i5.p1 TRINITY_DN2790_c0_g1~~TRINITY_DN2790_c0_g1_i5.p1  ORF type:complete len:427 (+),score=161.31 TRINITY_DN2790_c0_g1_i5:32-1282(+)
MGEKHNPTDTMAQTQANMIKELAKQSMADNDTFGAVALEESSPLDQSRIQRKLEDELISKLQKSSSKIFHLGDVLPYVHQGLETIVQDDFSKCFTSNPSPRWNWNTYLAILYSLGVVFRYCILFPLRLLILIVGVLGLIGVFVGVTTFIKDKEKRAKWQRQIIRWICGVFVLSWTGVIKYHGVIPARKPNQIYVANHTSMIDLIVLEQMNTFAAVGQKHKGWIAAVQDYVLGCLGCVWFDRASLSNRDATAKKIREHINNPKSNRLLIFPEGTCVNNEYCVQFKKGAFEMDAEVCPIAIKYNKIFVDAFWNSREQSFGQHLISLMTSWAVVCDVWYLEPQRIQPGENAIQFSSRVKKMIADRAGLKNVEFDGYLKHFKPSQRYVEERQKLFVQSLRQRFPRRPSLDAAEVKEERQR